MAQVSMTVYIGTSGFYYPEWVGPVYPDGTSTARMLEIYSSLFDALEINSTFYRPPSKDSFKKYPERTGGQIKVVVKLNRAFTHERNAEIDDARIFDDAVKPLVESGQFASFLAQFPQSFHNVNETREYIEKLKSLFPKASLTFEFRHKSWWNRETLEFLKKLGVSTCSVDSPDLQSLPPSAPTFTGEPGYLRCHGRNAADWYKGENARYTYKYKKNELEEILARVKKLVLKSEVVYVFFNNHPQGNAAVNATDFVDMLRGVLPDTLPNLHRPRNENSGQIDLFHHG